MSISYNAPLQSARMTAVVNAIDINVLPASIEIGTAAMTAILVSITLGDPSFTVAGAPPNVTATLTGVPKSGIATANGTAAAARIKDGGGTIVVSGLTVGTAGTDILLNSTTISSGQTVTINSGTLTHAP